MTIMARDKIGAVRGMRDILPDMMRRHRRVSEVAHKVACLYGFKEIATPIVEYSEVFKRSLGASSDVVNKEMYLFHDRKGEELVLRPENTASIVRAFISSELQNDLPARLFYNGPMFRYERPQSGRYRQFHQIGVELLGNKYPFADIEVIACGWQILKDLGLASGVSLQLNSLGDAESRAAYRKALTDYLQDYKEKLSEDSQRRLQDNPLRVLDSKSPEDKGIACLAPKITDYLNNYSRDFFASVCDMLRESDISFEANPHLVRGLDYYCHTVFEFVTESLGAQGTVLAGGRYDGLVAALGGNDISGIGWAAGIERLALMTDEPPDVDANVAILGIGEQAQRQTMSLAHILRRGGIAVYHRHKGNIKKQIMDSNIAVILIIGDDELAKKSVKLKDMSSGEEIMLSPPYDFYPSKLRFDAALVKLLQSALAEFYGKLGQ